MLNTFNALLFISKQVTCAVFLYGSKCILVSYVQLLDPGGHLCPSQVGGVEPFASGTDKVRTISLSSIISPKKTVKN